MMIALALLMSTLGLMLCGPSKIVGFSPINWLRIVGWVILSISKAIFDACSYKELVRSVHLNSGLNLDNPILNKRADFWHCLFCSLGSIIGPILAAGIK